MSSNANDVYIVLLIILSIVCCFLFYLLRKNRKGISSPDRELTQSETELKEILRRQELALRSINFGLVYIDRDFRVVWETTNKIQQLVVKHKYIPGQLCYQTTGLEKEACMDCPFKAAVSAGKMATRMMNVDGMSFEVTATPVYDGPGHELIGGLLRIEDVTKKIQMNNSWREAKEKAEEANRLKSAFLANISHEIRTPLNTILGFADMITQNDDKDSKEEFNKIIQNNSGILLRLIDDILDLSKIEAGKVEFNYTSVDINELLFSVLTQIKQKNNETLVKLTVTEQLEKCIIKADKVQLTQIITNLVNNAIKFTPQGTVSIGYRVNEDPDEFYLYVKDTGIGIPADKQQIIFDRFTKLDPFVQGAGLGLSICKSIVSLQGGEIGVDSAEGEGSCFWFRIPAKLARG